MFFDVHDIVRTNQILTESLEYSASTMKENFDALRDNKAPETLGKISFDLDNCQLKSLEQYLNWIISDVNLIQVTIGKAVETDAIEKYRKLT